MEERGQAEQHQDQQRRPVEAAEQVERHALDLLRGQGLHQVGPDDEQRQHGDGPEQAGDRDPDREQPPAPARAALDAVGDGDRLEVAVGRPRAGPDRHQRAEGGDVGAALLAERLPGEVGVRLVGLVREHRPRQLEDDPLELLLPLGPDRVGEQTQRAEDHQQQRRQRDQREQRGLGGQAGHAVLDGLLAGALHEGPGAADPARRPLPHALGPPPGADAGSLHAAAGPPGVPGEAGAGAATVLPGGRCRVRVHAATLASDRARGTCRLP